MAIRTDESTGNVVALKVTVVVPTYNSGTLVDPLIDAMRAQTLPADAFEVLFVDDGSTDGTPDRLAELAAREPLFRVIRLVRLCCGR